MKNNVHCAAIACVHPENSRIFWSYTTSYCLCNSVSDSYQVLYIHGDSTYFSIHIEWVIVHLIFCNKNTFFSSAEFCLTTWENNDLGFFAWYLSVSQWAHRCCMQCTVWQYGLWSFQTGGTKLERFLPKNQYTQRILLNFENWVSGEVSRIEHQFSK